MAKTIVKTQLRELRELLGESTFQRIQREVWGQFSFKAPPINRDGNLAPLALFGVWNELIQALRDAAKRLRRDKESASRIAPVSGPLWELLKSGVTWSATL